MNTIRNPDKDLNNEVFDVELYRNFELNTTQMRKDFSTLQYKVIILS